MKNYFNLLWIILSYVSGSFPSGFIITKLSAKRNILEIGWRKTSGSNVFRNVGKWQGILTGVLDLGKGFLPVYLAQKLGLPTQIQALSGVAAVTGHNWSCFLKFAGGRGIGTFAGAALALSSKILGFSLIPLIALGIIWNLSIGTILFLMTFIFLSYRSDQFETARLFVLISLIPIFVKRLSPIKEIKKSKNKTILIRNRLIFDDNQAHLDLRIKRIFKRLTKK